MCSPHNAPINCARSRKKDCECNSRNELRLGRHQCGPYENSQRNEFYVVKKAIAIREKALKATRLDIAQRLHMPSFGERAGYGYTQTL